MADRKTAQKAINRLNTRLQQYDQGLISAEEMMIETWDDLFEVCKHYEALVQEIKDERDQKWQKLCSTVAVYSASPGA